METRRSTQPEGQRGNRSVEGSSQQLDGSWRWWTGRAVHRARAQGRRPARAQGWRPARAGAALAPMAARHHQRETREREEREERGGRWRCSEEEEERGGGAVAASREEEEGRRGADTGAARVFTASCPFYTKPVKMRRRFRFS